MPDSLDPPAAARTQTNRARRSTGRSVLSDVAKLAGVSTATVSRVYNEPDMARRRRAVAALSCAGGDSGAARLQLPGDAEFRELRNQFGEALGQAHHPGHTK